MEIKYTFTPNIPDPLQEMLTNTAHTVEENSGLKNIHHPDWTQNTALVGFYKEEDNDRDNNKLPIDRIGILLPIGHTTVQKSDGIETILRLLKIDLHISTVTLKTQEIARVLTKVVEAAFTQIKTEMASLPLQKSDLDTLDCRTLFYDKDSEEFIENEGD